MQRKSFKICVLLLAISFALVSYILVWIALTLGPLKKNTLVVINKAPLLNVASQLQEQEAISNRISFFIVAKLANYLTKIKAGEYELQEGSSIWHIIRNMQSGKFFKRSITIPEGYTTSQILELVEQNPFLIGNPIKDKYPEGALLPETYFFIRNEKREDILNRMESSMQKIVDEIWENRDKTIPLNNKSELLILASIIEKEAKVKEEQPIIASVFINRLTKKMKLESDPTTIYSITKGKHILERLLTRNDLKTASPFNTYYAKGLPPTPIANPGIGAIKAASNPAQTKYLFFVVKDCQGNHSFSLSLKEHINHVMKYKKLKC
jgi:UPF0755 protein